MTVTKSEDAPWDILKPEVFAAIMDFFSSGQTLFLNAQTATSNTTTISEVWFVDPLSMLSFFVSFMAVLNHFCPLSPNEILGFCDTLFC